MPVYPAPVLAPPVESLLGSDLHTQATARFINVRPEQITVVRRPRFPSDAGGFLLGPEERLPSQTVRKILLGSAPARVDENGEMVDPRYAIIGMPELNLMLFDLVEFFDSDKLLKIVHVDRLPEWRTSAEAFEYV